MAAEPTPTIRIYTAVTPLKALKTSKQQAEKQKGNLGGRPRKQQVIWMTWKGTSVRIYIQINNQRVFPFLAICSALVAQKSLLWCAQEEWLCSLRREAMCQETSRRKERCQKCPCMGIRREKSADRFTKKNLWVMPSAMVLDLWETRLNGADQNQRKDDICRRARKPNSNETTVLWTLCARSPSAGQASKETARTPPTIKTRPRIRTKISNYNIMRRRANHINIKLQGFHLPKPTNFMPRIGRAVLMRSTLETGLERQAPPTVP